jgi:hypothetical protein
MNIDKNLIKYWGMLFESEEAKDRNAVLPMGEKEEELEIDAEIEEVPDEEASKSDENLEEEDKDYTASDILKVKRILNTFQIDESVLKRGFGFDLTRENQVDALFDNKFDSGRNLRMWMNAIDVRPRVAQRGFDDIFSDGGKTPSPYQLVSLVYLTENDEIGFRSFIQEKSSNVDIGFIFNMKFPLQKEEKYKTKSWINEEDGEETADDNIANDDTVDEEEFQSDVSKKQFFKKLRGAPAGMRKEYGVSRRAPEKKKTEEMGMLEYMRMNLATYKQFLLPYIMLIDSM